MYICTVSPFEQDSSERNSTVNHMQRRPLLFLMLALALVFVASYTSRLTEYRRLQTQKASLQAQIVDAEARGRQLLADLSYVKSNEYVEAVAINELDMAKEGVTVLTIIDEPVQPEIDLDAPSEAEIESAVIEQAETAQATSDRNNGDASGWRQWLSIFSATDE